MTSGIQQGASPASHQPQQLLTEHLDLWTTAVRHKSTAGRGSGNGKKRKIELAGIHKIRELILELAVRGKLVPQNPDDEPASELLKRIEAEKAQLIKDGKLKKQKPLPPVTDEEKPFELPQGWEWVSISSIGYDHGQVTPTGDFTYIDVSAIDNTRGVIREPNILSASEAPSRARKVVKLGTVIYSTVRPYLKNIAVINKDYTPSPIASTAFVIVHPWSGISSTYIAAYLHSPIFVKYVESVQTGIAYPAINDKQFFGGLFPLPPANEQQRIVAKVDELMALCDQLEQQSEHQLDAHQQLTETLLSALLTPAAGALTNATSAQELNDNWQRLAQHFDLLFSGPMGAWAIDRLKDTILQLAVMGKLVPQNPNDEPAAELLKRIDAEKARLVKEGKIKKQKPLPPVSDDEKPFELPKGWEWSRLPEIGELARGKSKHRPRNDPRLYKEGKYPLIQTGDVARSNGSISTYGATYNDFGLEQSRLWPAKTLCITIAANIADTGLLEFDACFPDSVVGFNGFLSVNNRFYEFFVRTYKEKLAEFAPSTAQKNINLEILSSMLVPVSPLAEQQRIVAKVDELFTLCDQLKERLQQASDTQLNLTEAIVDQALN